MLTYCTDYRDYFVQYQVPCVHQENFNIGEAIVKLPGSHVQVAIQVREFPLANVVKCVALYLIDSVTYERLSKVVCREME